MSIWSQNKRTSILFLTPDVDPTVTQGFSFPARATTLPFPRVQNKILAEYLHQQGADVQFLPWTCFKANVSTKILSSFDYILFLSCDKYEGHIDDFYDFLRDVLIPLHRNCRDIQIINNPEVILWNMDKRYLKDLEDAGFPVLRTTFLASSSVTVPLLSAAIRSFAGAKNLPVILKPSISASGANVHLVRDPGQVTTEDSSYMEFIASHLSNKCSLMIQDFEPSICTTGEYSLVFIGGIFSHATLKTPVANGKEYRINVMYHGRLDDVTDGQVPDLAVSLGYEIWAWLCERFGSRAIGYMRLDGMVQNTGKFIIGEIELIEPDMWLDRHVGGTFLQDTIQRLFQRESRCEILGSKNGAKLLE
jgi:glutathione synthase/RimK-type ligase-like ATP-grasp enzyme